MRKTNNIWFNEDGNVVFGVKNAFVNEKEFIKEAKKEHLKLMGCDCEITNIDSDVFLSLDKPLREDYLYKLVDCGATIETLYYGNCECNDNL